MEVDLEQGVDYAWVMVQEANDEIEKEGTGRVSAWGATQPLMPTASAVEQHVLRHYPLNNIRPIEIKECSKGKAV